MWHNIERTRKCSLLYFSTALLEREVIQKGASNSQAYRQGQCEMEKLHCSNFLPLPPWSCRSNFAHQSWSACTSHVISACKCIKNQDCIEDVFLIAILIIINKLLSLFLLYFDLVLRDEICSRKTDWLFGKWWAVLAVVCRARTHCGTCTDTDQISNCSLLRTMERPSGLQRSLKLSSV